MHPREKEPTGARRRNLVVWIFAAIAAILAGGHILYFTVVALLRMGHPYEFNVVEGGVLMHVARVLAGQPIYAQPSMDFISFVYPPFYYYLSAGASLVIGFGFLPLRLVSFAATLGCVGVLYCWVKRETGDRLSGLLGAGGYVAFYWALESAHDFARVDSLFVFLLFAGLYLLRCRTTRGGQLLAAVVLTLA